MCVFQPAFCMPKRTHQVLLRNSPSLAQNSANPLFQNSGTDMTGRPGYRTMEMIGGSSAPYLARTPCVPLFCTSFNRVGNKERFRLPGAGGGSFPLYGGTFARSYSVTKNSTLRTVFPPFPKMAPSSPSLV